MNSLEPFPEPGPATKNPAGSEGAKRSLRPGPAIRALDRARGARLRAQLGAVLAATLVLAACGQSADEPVAGLAPEAREVKGAVAVLDLPYDSTPHVDEAARVSQEIAWRIIQHTDGSNRLTSPSSLTMSLAQAAEGAQTVSLASIDSALGLTGDDRARAFGALRQSLLPYDSLPDQVDVDDPPETPVVHQASRVLAIDAELEQPFLDRIAEFYDAGAAQAPHREAKANLDAWVRLHTAGLIEQSGVEVKADTVAVMQDAVLFAAAWRTAFDVEGPVPFEDGEVDGVRGDITGRYAEGDGWAAVRLPYDDNLAADIVLPAGAPEALTHEDLEAVTAALDVAPESLVSVAMPIFDLKSKTDLMEALSEINLLDLGGIFPGGYGDQWVQQVVLQVSKKGTVGAAVTELVVAESAVMADHVLNVDRPYVFRVLDTRTAWPLFLATIGDPAAGP